MTQDGNLYQNPRSSKISQHESSSPSPTPGGWEKSGSQPSLAGAAGAVLSPPGREQGVARTPAREGSDADRLIAFAETVGIPLLAWQKRTIAAILANPDEIRLGGRRGGKSGGRTAPESRPQTPIERRIGGHRPTFYENGGVIPVGSDGVPSWSGPEFRTGHVGVWTDAIPTLPEHMRPNPMIDTITIRNVGHAPTPRDVADITREIRGRRKAGQ